MADGGQWSISAMVRKALQHDRRRFRRANRVLSPPRFFVQVSRCLHADRSACVDSLSLVHCVVIKFYGRFLVLRAEINRLRSHASDLGRLIIPDARVRQLIKAFEFHRARSVSTIGYQTARQVYRNIDKTRVSAAQKIEPLALAQNRHRRGQPTFQPYSRKAGKWSGRQDLNLRPPHPQVGGKVTSCLLSYFVSSFGLERGVA